MFWSKLDTLEMVVERHMVEKLRGSRTAANTNSVPNWPNSRADSPVDASSFTVAAKVLFKSYLVIKIVL